MKRALLIRREMLWTAVAAALAATVTMPAMAQQRVDNANARDANNRIGSSGYNEGGANRGAYVGVTGNDIVTGNVTGGKAFRGNVPYTDPRAFRESTGLSGIDPFLRDSSGPGYYGHGAY